MAKKKTPDELAHTIKDAARRTRHAATRRERTQAGTLTANRLFDTECRQVDRMEKAVDELLALAKRATN